MRGVGKSEELISIPWLLFRSVYLLRFMWMKENKVGDAVLMP